MSSQRDNNMIEGIIQFTPEEKKQIREKRKERNRKRLKTLSWKRQVDRAIFQIYEMAVSRFERLIREKLQTSGYTQDEIERVIRNKHQEQVPLIKQEPVEDDDLAFKYNLWKPIMISEVPSTPG
jgi:hypothetical protein